MDQRDQRMDRMMEQLTRQVATLMENQNRRNPNPNSNLDREETKKESEGENYFADIPRRQQREPIEGDMQRWEAGIRTDILEFQGGLQPEEFLDWLVTVEEILEFKGVPNAKRVQLVVTRLRGRATAWWQQSPDSAHCPSFDRQASRISRFCLCPLPTAHCPTFDRRPPTPDQRWLLQVDLGVHRLVIPGQ
ncbi:hypothetical protein CRG98_040997 [Punica granatum]|uniref:Retrotransposon gag domain-containing protein n=1 Tax=Punica granatum TaxID=22663 RepID=A0A2I0I3K3_PUNGR|nr:hypothetical protein CRG98_040997 [Punica granatum]